MRREILRAEHLENFVIRKHEQEVFPPNHMQTILHGTRSDAVLDDEGNVLAVIGFFKMWDGVAEVFVVPSEKVSRLGVKFVWFTRKALADMMKENDLRRVQSTARRDACTERWMIALGFKCEGLLVKYAVNGEDYKLWARLAQ